MSGGAERRGQAGRGGGAAGPAEAAVGVLEWFAFEEHARVERAIEALERLGVRRLRTGFSWADWHRPGGQAWLGWLVSQLTARFEVLPCFHYVPPSLGEVPSTAAPPTDLDAYAHFVAAVLERWGDAFDAVELWNEPNNQAEWDYTRDPGWVKFAAMVGAAAAWARGLGKQVVLGGMSPVDPNFLEALFERDLMRYVDVVGVHGFPGTWEAAWGGWAAEIARVQAVLDRHGSPARVWITEAGYSTARHDDHAQVLAFMEALEAPAERLYWYALSDLAPERAATTGFHVDERDYHCGLLRTDGGEKLLHRLWRQGGLPAVREVAGWVRGAAAEGVRVEAGHHAARPALVTGGAGFVGSNLADRLLRDGGRVVLLDDLSRPGVEDNVRWLLDRHGDRVRFEAGDVRSRFAVQRALAGGVDAVYHLAAQVAVTTSLADPRADFDVNARGTVHLLEALRGLEAPPPLVYTSTNKVYGALEDLGFVEAATRYVPTDPQVARHGVDEARPLDMQSPYGCSKGCADQYVLDYARSFGLPTVVLRMSCIYGPRQLGTEDQGWVAHFLRAALDRTPLTVFGDGKQVRDVLFVDDLVDAFLRARRHIGGLRGRAFNLGGGPERTLSLLELLAHLRALHGAAPPVRYEGWRVGDQRYYVSDTRRFEAATGWRPRVGVAAGLQRLHAWLGELRAGQAPRGATAAGRPAGRAGNGDTDGAASEREREAVKRCAS